jgi:uncharacterized coiled-coil protein SlyX
MDIEIPDNEDAACVLDVLCSTLARQGQYAGAEGCILAARRLRADAEEIARLEARIAEAETTIGALKHLIGEQTDQLAASEAKCAAMLSREEEYCKKRCFGHGDQDVTNWVTEAAYLKIESQLAASEAKCKELRESAKRAFEEQHDRTNECLKERAARAEAERLAVWAIEFDAWHSSATNRLHFGTGPSSGSNVPCDGTPAGILAALRQAEEATR